MGWWHYSYTYKYCENKLIEDEVNDDIKEDYYKLQFLYHNQNLLIEKYYG